MLSTNPENRPSVEQLQEIPKIKLRMSEREMREQYSKLKTKEQELSTKEQTLKKRELELAQKEEALKEREQRA